MDNRPFSTLPPEEPRSSNQYKVQAGNPSLLFDNKRAKTYSLDTSEHLEALVENLAHDMVIISNWRVDRYDPLLNVVEAWTKLYHFIIAVHPALLTSGALQPLVDLDACLHDLTVGRYPGLVFHRPRLMDGGFRSLDEFFKQRAEGKNPREPSDRAVRTYRDQLEARVLLVLEALKRAYPAEQTNDKKKTDKQQRAAINPILAKLLNEFDIRTIDDKKGNATTPTDVWNWARTLQEDGRSGGRRYAYERVAKQFEAELEYCSSPEQAMEFAREQFERVRCLQPINRPLADGEKSRPRRKPKSYTPTKSVVTKINE